ncbi:hypothetical protein B0H12DRAFT_436930 [Mycena haematopus]|nr:hypothetical protein B0H12DRAFT_436930 [Mycena haematopus]
MPRQGWGPAPQGTPAPWGGNSGPPTPWDTWGQHAPPQHPDGFSAMAAPPQESSSGQPIGASFFNGGGGGGGGGRRGMSREALEELGWDDGDDDPWGDPRERERETWGQAPEAWGRGQDPRMAERPPQWANWGPQGHDPRALGHDPRDPRPTWDHDPRTATAWEHDPRAAAAWHDGGGAELMRTHSQGQPRSPGMKKKRSSSSKRRRAASFSGGQPQPQGGWGIPATFDENNLSRRPEDWRDGYSPRGISGADISFSSLFRVGKKADLNGWPDDTKKRTLAPVLTYNASRPNISYDLRRSPEDTQFMGNFQPRSQREMVQPAVTPPTVRMRLLHPRLPWYVDVLAPFPPTHASPFPPRTPPPSPTPPRQPRATSPCTTSCTSSSSRSTRPSPRATFGTTSSGGASARGSPALSRRGVRRRGSGRGRSG